MNELVTLVAQRAGLNQETAQKAVETVIGVLNQTLPASIATHLGALLAGDVSGGDRQYGQRSGGNVEGCNWRFLSKEIGRQNAAQAVFIQARSTSATLQACAMQPPA